MKTILRHIFLLIFILVTTSFIHKDLNEYGEWLKFYNLKDDKFVQVGADRQLKLEWGLYNLTDDYKKLYDSLHLYFYSSDSSFFLDLDSYNVILDKDTDGQIVWFGGDPEDKVELIRTKDQSAATLMFFGGTVGFAETAIWRNKNLFEIFGFSYSDNKYVPTIWKYDLEKKTIKEFANKKTFKTRELKYVAEMRLRHIKEKQ